MANTIVDLSGDLAIQMSAGQFARMPLPPMFVGWSRIRVCLFGEFSDSGASVAGTPRFGVGICSGTSNIPGDATVTNFVGSLTTSGSGWTRTTSTTRYFLNQVKPVKYINTTLTLSAGSFTAGAMSANGSPCMWFTDITKGSPNYSVTIFTQSGTSPGGVTLTDFNNQSIASTPAATNHTYNGPQTIATDETAGAFNAACVWFDQLTPVLRIRAFKVVRFA